MGATEMTALPAGFELEPPAAAQAPALPDGFALEPALATPTEGNMPSMFPSIMYGLRRPIDAAAQMLGRAGEAVFPSQWMTQQREATDKAVTEARQSYEADPGKTGGWMDTAGRGIGETVLSLAAGYAMPGAGAASLLGRVGSGAATGAVTNALQPSEATNASDFWTDKAKLAGTGAAMGGAVPLATGAISRVISPKTSDAVKLLLDNGVTPSPGQILGGGFNSLEQKATSIPGVGGSIAGARNRAMQQMNRTVINKALEPIGETSTAPLGREAIDEAATKISDAFNKTVPNLTSKIDPQFATDMSQLTSMAKDMMPERARQFAGIIDNQVMRKIAPSGVITGESAHEMQSTLGRLASEAHQSRDMDQRLLGDALQQAQSNILDLIGRSNPTGAEAFQAARAAYRNFMPVRQASSYLGTQEGVFSPAQLLSGVRASDRSLNKSAFARGNANGQEFADAAKSVLGNNIPDSGTAGRKGLWEIPTLLGGMAYSGHPLAALGAAGAGAGTMLGYTPAGQAIMRGLLASRPAGAEGVAQGVRSLAPGLSGVVRGLLSGP